MSDYKFKLGIALAREEKLKAILAEFLELEPHLRADNQRDLDELGDIASKAKEALGHA